MNAGTTTLRQPVWADHRRRVPGAPADLTLHVLPLALAHSDRIVGLRATAARAQHAEREEERVHALLLEREARLLVRGQGRGRGWQRGQ